LKTDLDVIACVDDGEGLFEAAIIVTDISMPKLSGIQVAKSAAGIGLLVQDRVSNSPQRPDVIRAALETGALGYVGFRCERKWMK
jgi:DNA-binding NarL/FixJ family response regulator